MNVQTLLEAIQDIDGKNDASFAVKTGKLLHLYGLPFDIEKFDKYFSGTDSRILRVRKKPQTVDDFISDCLRAGIELKWNMETVIKYNL